MKTMSISPPDEAMAFVESQMAREGRASATEYLLTLVREDQRRKAKRELDEKLLEGLEGPSIEMTREDWDAFRAEALEGLRGEDVRP